MKNSTGRYCDKCSTEILPGTTYYYSILPLEETRETILQGRRGIGKSFPVGVNGDIAIDLCRDCLSGIKIKTLSFFLFDTTKAITANIIRFLNFICIFRKNLDG